MSRNGSGTYTLPSAAFVAGTTIDPSPMNANFTDIAAQLTNSVAADGQTTMTGALNLGSHAISNVTTISSAGTLAISSALTTTTGVVSTGYDAGGANFRAAQGNYGIMLRNDGTTSYLLLTNSGSAVAGAYNSLRPLSIANATGVIGIDGTGVGVTFGGAVVITSGLTLNSGLQVNGGAVVTGATKSNGYTTKAGTAGAYGANNYNIYWNGSNASLYMDAVLLGAFAYTSDPRIKQGIVDAPGGALDRVMQWRVVEYEFADVGIWRADGSRHLGFDAAQLRQINEKIVTGAPDDLTPDGDVQPMTLNILPMLAEITAALQAVVRRVDALEHTSR